MQMVAEPTPADWLDGMEKKLSAVNALAQLVEASTASTDTMKDDAWVHTAFYTYRSGMGDNDPDLPRLARIEHDFIAALGALNFGDQMRQLRQALTDLQAFHHVHR